MKKPAVGLFHNSSAESEAPGTKINSLVTEPMCKKRFNFFIIENIKTITLKEESLWTIKY
ncbi:hypothetical protein V7201_11450 [Bacillus sp. JJ1122]|uniref:hypothetical protein n=1 Tax=Bacillus sp. JJ1122 TaxID=3122951 RepID=UPI002FFE338F